MSRDHHTAHHSGGLFLWLIVSATLLTAFAWAAVRPPAPTRLIGIFACGFGVAAGLIVAVSSSLVNRLPRKALIGTASLLALAAFALSTFLHYRERLAQHEQRTQPIPGTNLAMQMAEQGRESSDAQAQEHFQQLHDSLQEREAQREQELTFATYHVQRLQPLGDLRPTLATAVWGLELLMVAGVAGFTAACSQVR